MLKLSYKFHKVTMSHAAKSHWQVPAHPFKLTVQYKKSCNGNNVRRDDILQVGNVLKIDFFA